MATKSEQKMKELRDAEDLRQKKESQKWKTTDWKNEDIPEEVENTCSKKHMSGALTTENMRNYRSCLDSHMSGKKPAKKDPKKDKFKELTKGRPTLDI